MKIISSEFGEKKPQLKPNGINKRRANSKKRIERALEYYSW